MTIRIISTHTARQMTILFLGIFLLLSAACSPSETERPTKIPSQTPTPTPPAVATARPTKEPTATATPVPTLPILRSTPIPGPSRTPTPTRTPRPTDTPAPTRTWRPIPTQTIPAGVVVEWPELNHDLLFLAEDSLKLWDHETEQLVVLLRSTAAESTYNQDPFAPPLPGIIYEFNVSQDGRTVVAGRIVSGHPLVQQLIWLDLETRESRILAEEIPYLWRPKLSPDGRRVAYVSGDAAGFNFEGPETGIIYVQELEGSQPAVHIENCMNTFTEGQPGGKGCKRHHMLWTPDGRKLLWADVRGVVAYELSTGTLNVLQANLYTAPSPLDGRSYSPIDWSPSGRYLRLETTHYEGGSESILDMVTGQLFDIPDSFAYDYPYTSIVTWMQDDRLLNVRLEGPRDDRFNILEIWRPASSGQWVMEDSVELLIKPDTFITGPTQFADGSLAFGLVSRGDVPDPIAGLYRLDSLHSIPEQMTEIPWMLFGTFMDWAPDDSGALVSRGQVAYVPVGEPAFYGLRPLVGLFISEVRWLP